LTEIVRVIRLTLCWRWSLWS